MEIRKELHRRNFLKQATPPPGYTLSCRLSERVLLLTSGRSLGAPDQPATRRKGHAIYGNAHHALLGD
jgi:hypothetical protein